MVSTRHLGSYDWRAPLPAVVDPTATTRGRERGSLHHGTRHRATAPTPARRRCWVRVRVLGAGCCVLAGADTEKVRYAHDTDDVVVGVLGPALADKEPPLLVEARLFHDVVRRTFRHRLRVAKTIVGETSGQHRVRACACACAACMLGSSGVGSGLERAVVFYADSRRGFGGPAMPPRQRRCSKACMKWQRRCLAAARTRARGQYCSHTEARRGRPRQLQPTYGEKPRGRATGRRLAHGRVGRLEGGAFGAGRFLRGGSAAAAVAKLCAAAAVGCVSAEEHDAGTRAAVRPRLARVDSFTPPVWMCRLGFSSG